MASPKKSGTGLWFDSFTLVGASRSSPLGLFVSLKTLFSEWA